MTAWAGWVKIRIDDFRTGDSMYFKQFLVFANTAMLIKLTFELSFLHIMALAPLYFVVSAVVGKLHREHFLGVHMDLTRDQDPQFQELKKDVQEIKRLIREG